LLNLIGGHFLDQTASRIKSGKTFRGTGDNYDLRILKGHMRKGLQNDDLHLFATNLIENRIDFNHVPNDSPLGDIKTFARNKFSPSASEIKKYAECVKVLVGRLVLEICPKFKFLKKVVPTHIEHASLNLLPACPLLMQRIKVSRLCQNPQDIRKMDCRNL
jgi:hypothetical protein